jgi:RNA polymerase sigma-70 factor (ECF subfamily)
MQTDEQLIAEYLKGDEHALRSLIERYLRPIYNFVYRYTGEQSHAEEITQDVFVNVWRNINRFDPDKKFKTWLFAIAKNTSLNWIKKKRPINFSRFENEEGDNVFLESTADPSPLPSELFERADLSRKLSEAMGRLSPNYKAVLILHYNEHMTFQEIAESIGESINTVKSRHRRALTQLKEFLVI